MSKISYKINEIDDIILKVEYNDNVFEICIYPVSIVNLFSNIDQKLTDCASSVSSIGYDNNSMDIEYFISIETDNDILVFAHYNLQSDIDDPDYDEEHDSIYIDFDEETSNMIFNTLYKLLVLYYESEKYKDSYYLTKIINMDEIMEKVNNILG